MAINIRGRHFLTLTDFSPLEIRYLLDLSKALKQKKQSGVIGNLLQGKHIVLLFEKASTRTRCAFEVAAQDEGAAVTFLENSHFGSKESMEDSARVLGRYYDGIEFRGFSQKTAQTLAAYAGVPVWNGLTDEAHPTQALADLLTIEEHVAKPLASVKIVFVGDARNNVCHSLMVGAVKMGMNFVALAPTSLFPDPALLLKMQAEAKKTGARLHVVEKIPEALLGADVVYTDVWVSMGEEDKLAERISLLKPYQVNSTLLAACKNPAVKFMHCLPACHDTKTALGKKVQQQFGLSAMEVSDDVFESDHSIVFDQAENRLHTIKAILVATIGNR